MGMMRITSSTKHCLGLIVILCSCWVESVEPCLGLLVLSWPRIRVDCRLPSLLQSYIDTVRTAGLDLSSTTRWGAPQWEVSPLQLHSSPDIPHNRQSLRQSSTFLFLWFERTFLWAESTEQWFISTDKRHHLPHLLGMWPCSRATENCKHRKF